MRKRKANLDFEVIKKILNDRNDDELVEIKVLEHQLSEMENALLQFKTQFLGYLDRVEKAILEDDKFRKEFEAKFGYLPKISKLTILDIELKKMFEHNLYWKIFDHFQSKINATKEIIAKQEEKLRSDKTKVAPVGKVNHADINFY